MNKIIKIITVSKGKFLNFVNINWQDSEGNKRVWETIERTTGPDIVSVIPATNHGEIIFIEQFRPAVGKMVIEFPAGMRDKGESLKEAALRELQEETGYQASKLKKLFYGPISAGLSSEFLTVFLATDLKFVGKKDGLEERGITVYKIPFQEINNWLNNKEKQGILVDIKTRPYLSYINNNLLFVS